MKRKPFYPLTEEESRLVAQWRSYAITVAFDRARRPIRDPNDIVSIGHDATIQAVRYYRPNKGSKNIQSFIVHLVTQRLHRLYHPKRLKVSLEQLAEVKPVVCCDGCGEGCAQTNEIVAKILSTASDTERKLIHEYFWEGKTQKEIARGKTSWSTGCQLKKCMERFRAQFKDLK